MTRTLTLLAILAPAFAHAQTSYPMLMSIHPVAAARGTTSAHVIESRYDMFGTWQVLVSGEGVTGKAVLPEVEEGAKPPTLTKLNVEFTVAPNALPGVREVRLATPRGVSTVGQLVVVRDSVVKEQPENDTFESAQKVEVPSTICGVIERNEDVDFYRFTVAEPTDLSFDVRSMRLQDKIHDLQQHSDPIMAIRNASGTTVATSDNHFRGDPFLAHRFEPGDYVLEIRDVRFEGNRYWTYSVEVSDRPFVARVHPLGVRRGETTRLELVGANVPDDATHAPLELPADAPLGPQRAVLPIGDRLTDPVSVVVSDAPQYIESEAENGTAAAAQLIEAVPAGINGRIESKADVDCFAFDAEKGEKYSFELFGSRVGSAIDSNLRILDATGKRLAESDDYRQNVRTYPDSFVENWTVPADGRYVIEVRDLHLRGGADFVYHVAVTRADPHFELYADTAKSQLTPGTAAAVFVRVVRKNGFTGPIQLRADGLPDGVAATSGRILDGKKTDGVIVFEAAPDAGLTVGEITLTGTATIESDEGPRELTTTAVPQQETYQPGGGRGHWPVLKHTVNVGEPSDIRAVTLSTHEIVLKPGDSAKIDVTIERAEGFDKPVNLDLLYRHLNRVYGDSLPEGVTIDAKNSKTRLNGKESTGHITLVADAKAAPVERQQTAVMANVALNFVMKATYAARPVFVTVAAE